MDGVCRVSAGQSDRDTDWYCEWSESESLQRNKSAYSDFQTGVTAGLVAHCDNGGQRGVCVG